MKTKLLFWAFAATVTLFVGAACDDNADGMPSERIEPLPENLRSVLTDGKKWITEHAFSTSFVDDYIDTVIVDGDTHYEGYDAKTVKRLRDDGSEYGVLSVMREEDGKVYQFMDIEGGYDEDFKPLRYRFYGLQYDLNAQCGDTIGPFYEYVIVVSRGTILLMNKMRRAVKVYCNFYRGEYQYDYWVEGIGPLFRGVPDYTIVRPTGHPVKYRRLLECYDGDKKIYDYREFNEDLYSPTEVFEDFVPGSYGGSYEE